MHRFSRWAFIALVLSVVQVAAARAQDPPPATAQVPVGDSLMVADTIPSEPASPRAAFARALVVPGWGHFGIGSHRRGAVFATLQGASWFMLIKTLAKLDRADDRLGEFEAIASDSLRALMAADTAAARRLEDELAFEDAVAAHQGVAGAQGLVDSRTEQRQDWITYTLFFTMASAVDAYVAAYLKDFPADVSVAPRSDGAFALRMRVPVGRTVQ